MGSAKTGTVHARGPGYRQGGTSVQRDQPISVLPRHLGLNVSRGTKHGRGVTALPGRIRRDRLDRASTGKVEECASDARDLSDSSTSAPLAIWSDPTAGATVSRGTKSQSTSLAIHRSGQLDKRMNTQGRAAGNQRCELNGQRFGLSSNEIAGATTPGSPQSSPHRASHPTLCSRGSALTATSPALEQLFDGWPGAHHHSHTQLLLRVMAPEAARGQIPCAPARFTSELRPPG